MTHPYRVRRDLLPTPLPPRGSPLRAKLFRSAKRREKRRAMRVALEDAL